MWQCAIEYCDANAVDPERIRIDAVAIELDHGGRVTGIEHFRAVDIPGD